MEITFVIESPTSEASAKAKAYFESLSIEQKKVAFEGIKANIEYCLNDAYRWLGQDNHDIAIQQLVHASRAIRQAQSLHVGAIPDWQIQGLVDLLAQVGRG